MKQLALLMLVLSACTNRLVDDVPRLYACDRNEGLNACPGGWRCGLSGFCQDPAQAQPYACESSDDCSASWHCGPERLCYDRAAATDRSCRASLESSPDTSDCAPAWRCGREVRGQVCHPVGTGAAYLCSTDSDCEATWRCGPEGACVDVAAQGLRGADVSVMAKKVSPLLPNQVDLVDVRIANFGDRSATLIANNTLFVATSSPVSSDPQRATLETTPLLRPVHALARTEQHLLVTDSMGLVDYKGAFDAGGATVLVPSLANAELRYAAGDGNADEELASFSGTSVGVCERGLDPQVCDPSSFQFSTLPAPVKDVAFLQGFGRASVLAATSAGPYLALRNNTFVALDGGSSATAVWRPVSLRGLSDACATSPASIDRLVYDPAMRTLAATTDQDRRVSVFTLSPFALSSSPCAELSTAATYGPCTACGAGEVLLGLGSNVAPNTDEVVALCQRNATDGGSNSVVSYRHHSPDGGCGLEPLTVPAGVHAGYRVSSALRGVDAVGNPRACADPSCLTMLAPTAPQRVAGGPALLGTHSDDVLGPSGYVTPPSGISGPLGLQPVSYDRLYVAGSVPENQDWMISSAGRPGTVGEQRMVVHSMRRKLAGLQQDIAPLAFFSRSSDLLPSAFGNTLIDSSGTRSFSTIATDAEGQPWLIVGAGDRIWADDSRLLGEDAGTRIIDIKAVPLPSSDIQSLAFTAYARGDAGTGPLLEGYTVAQSRLFRVVVHTPTLWLSDEIRLGETSSAAVSVWMEQGHGRVGTSDGRVFGLPVPVPLSATIPEAPLPHVFNYGSLCGQGFAVSSTALYRLSLETPPLGTWKRVSLEAALPGVDTWGPHWSAVTHHVRVGTQEHLYLFSETGLVVDLVATCP